MKGLSGFRLLVRQITSGEHAKTSAMESLDIHRLKRSDLRLHQPSAPGRHHSIQQRRGPAHPLQTMPVHRHTLASDKPLIRRKRIRRDGSTPTVTGRQASALKQAQVSHPPAAHRHPSVDLLRDKSKQKRGRDAKITHRRKSVRPRGRGHSLPHNLASLYSPHLSYGEHSRRRTTRRPVRRSGAKTSLAEHGHKQEARSEHPLVSGVVAYRTRRGKSRVAQTDRQHHLSAGSANDSNVDEISTGPVAVHDVRVLPQSSGFFHIVRYPFTVPASDVVDWRWCRSQQTGYTAELTVLMARGLRSTESLRHVVHAFTPTTGNRRTTS